MRKVTDIDPEDRVIDETVARTFNVKGTLFFRDAFRGDGVDYSQAKVVVDGPVPVMTEDGEVVGSATIYDTGLQVMADMFLDYNTPVRLDIEMQTRPIYAFPIGSETVELDGDSEKATVRSVSISSILLDGGDPPLDTRIRRLG